MLEYFQPLFVYISHFVTVIIYTHNTHKKLHHPRHNNGQNYCVGLTQAMASKLYIICHLNCTRYSIVLHKNSTKFMIHAGLMLKSLPASLVLHV